MALFMFRTFLALSVLTCLPVIGYAQTSSGLVDSNPKEQYYVIKRSLQAMYDRGEIRSHILPADDKYDLVLCLEVVNYLGPFEKANSLTGDLTYLALEIVIWRSDLKALGYPEEVWRPRLIEYEGRQLNAIVQGSSGSDDNVVISVRWQKDLVAALNGYRRQSRPSLKEVVARGGCGAGEISVRVSLEPRNGRVFFIPVFFYQLCQMQQLDPDNPDRCDRWHEALDGQLTYLAGYYRYLARWPDGATRKGTISVTLKNADTAVVIRKP
ncbi:MAG TPA: hypothetical protein VKB79_09440 [Bryobacteraceae bacterium]|nr:hypothetical protein [Bryobacteraceae bacterium]